MTRSWSIFDGRDSEACEIRVNGIFESYEVLQGVKDHLGSPKNPFLFTVTTSLLQYYYQRALLKSQRLLEF